MDFIFILQGIYLTIHCNKSLGKIGCVNSYITQMFSNAYTIQKMAKRLDWEQGKTSHTQETFSRQETRDSNIFAFLKREYQDLPFLDFLTRLHSPLRKY